MMEATKIVLFFVLATLSTSSAFNTVTPHQKEVIYNWNTLVKAGTLFPESFASQFELQGKVHVQADDNATHVKITDLTYKIYNGILDHVHEHEAHTVPVTPEVQDLQHVFKIVHDSHGHVVGIVTEKEEKEFSRNIKKAIASIFQIDDSVVKQQHHHPHASVVKEHSIYGYGDVDYNVIPHHDDVVEVHKWYDMHKSHHLYQYFFTNTEPTYCDIEFEESIMFSNHKKFIIVKQDGCHVVKHIDSHGGIYYDPYKGKSDAQFILDNQTFELHEVVPLQQQLYVQSEHYENRLTYHVAGDVNVETIPDMTNGRHVIDYSKLVPQVQEMLKEVHQYLQGDPIHLSEPNIKQGQLINRIERVLKQFSVEKLEELQKTLLGDSLDVFYCIIPLVGTKASVLYVKKLVVNKVVSDNVAVQLLQHMSEHIMIPTVDLITQMEELIHLGENIHWNVRKVAILSFASLIHKSHKLYHTQHKLYQQHQKVAEGHAHHVEVDNQELEKPYEKYVIEYIDKIKSSQDYKVQMTYILALHNMKLHSVVKHMLPAFDGEWWHDRHLRFLSLMATSHAIVTDPNPDTMIETLWPIFTNRKEHTEMRILAYYFIMESQPSPLRMRNVFTYLILEPNKEVHHFHYTYVHTMLQSKEPCRQQFRVKLAQMMTFMYPPTYGVSNIQLYEYRDVNYGFSGGIQNYFISTNYSQIYSALVTSQAVNVFHEDYMFYLKVHGVYDKNFNPSNILIDTFRKRLPKISDTKDVRIEYATFRNGQFTNAFYFDEHNIQELGSLLSFFTKDSESVAKDLLFVDYYRYHKAVIPTDLGTAAVWEYLIPIVHQSKISISKEVVNNVINVCLNGRHINSIHSRNGLSFYNPIVDVWQGINKYNAYDQVVHLNFEITVNTRRQSLRIFWKRPYKQQNVSGLKTHVKQMVFVKDDYHRNILVQSSPNCKDFQTVTNRKEYRNDITLLDEEIFNTGHRWYMHVYESGYISNGSFNHLIHQFILPYNKHYDSPLSHLWMSYSNWQHYLLLMPKPGISGFTIRVEPGETNVNNIVLFLRVHNEIANDTYYYTPASKWTIRVTYIVKDYEGRSLKAWDVNAIIDMNLGHTVNNLKMHLTRIVPREKDYKICVDGVKSWTKNGGVEGHLNVAMSQTPGGKCVKDDTVIDVTMRGQRSDEQIFEAQIYRFCPYTIPYAVPHYHTLQCLASHTSLRHYIYNVKTTNVPTEFKKTFVQWWDHIKGHYMQYYAYRDEHNDSIGEHNLKVDVVYLMQEHALDVHVTTPQHIYSLTGVPIDYWRSLGLVPDSTIYSPWFQYLNDIGWVDHCVIHHDHHYFNHHHFVKEVVPSNWTLYIGDAEQNPHMGVFVKSVASDKIAVKVVCHDHVLEIVPYEKNSDIFHIILDGQKVINLEYHEDWVHYYMLFDDVNWAVTVMLPQSEIHFEYDCDHLVVLAPKGEQQLHGTCYAHH